MLNLIMNSFRKKVALFLTFVMIFSTNPVDLSIKTYANDNMVESTSEFDGSAVESTIDGESINEITSTETCVDEMIESSETDNAIETEEESDAKKIVESDSLLEPEEQVDGKNSKEKEIVDEIREVESATYSEINEELENKDSVDTIQITENENNESTKSELGADYTTLDTLSQILYQDSEGAFVDGDVIRLNKDIELNDTIYVREPISLDLAGYSLIGPRDDYALFIEDTFTLNSSGEEPGSIKGMAESFSTIYIKNADAEFIGGQVLGFCAADAEDDNIKDGGNAIEAFDSTLTFSGALVYGGNGKEFENEKGGDGGDAVRVVSAKNDNKILISSGALTGGSGANGIGDVAPELGAALKVDGKVYEYQYFGKGLPGNIGGGNGGVALNILSKKFKSANLTYEDYTLFAGHAGYSQDSSENEKTIEKNSMTVLDDSEGYDEEAEYDDENQSRVKVKVFKDTNYGASAEDAYFSLHDLDGKNYLTSLKNQRSTDLCTAFSTAAYAETALIKKYPDYVKNVLNKDVDSTYSQDTWNSNNNELNLSEMQFAMQMLTQPKDEFGNAGLSRTWNDGYDGANWSRRGFGEFSIVNSSSTWRSLVEEDDELAWSNLSGSPLTSQAIDRNFLNNYNDKTVVHAKSAKVYNAKHFYNGNNFDRDSFINTAKNAIINNAGVIFCVFTCRVQHQTTNNYTKNGINYGSNSYVLTAPSVYTNTSSGLGGHAMFCIGWDDDIDITTSDGESFHGAFICKNSWDEFAYVPYDSNFGLYSGPQTSNPVPNEFMSFIAIDFVPSFSEYENIYFYDSGLGGHYKNANEYYKETGFEFTDREFNKNVGYYVKVGYKSLLNTFTIRNKKEKIKAASIYVDKAGTYKVTVYKAKSAGDETLIRQSLVDANKLSEGQGECVQGVNTISLTEVDVKKDDIVAVVVTNVSDREGFGNAYIDDSYVNGKSHYVADTKCRGFYVDNVVSDVFKVIVDGVSYASGTAEFNTYYKQTIGDAVKSRVVEDTGIEYEGEGDFRIRLMTNNYVTLNANGEGDYNGIETKSIYPTLRSPLNSLVEPENVSDTKLFTKYNTKADGTGVDYDKESIYHISVAKELKLYAIYEDIFALTFNAGGGSGKMDAIKRKNGETAIVPSCTFVRTGYTFDKWVDENNAEVATGSTITMTGNKALTAKWNEKEYEIKYELNSGEFVSGYNSYPVIRKFTEDKDLPTSDKMVRSGFTFAGWYDNSALTGTALTKTNVANTEKVIVLYAKWNDNSKPTPDPTPDPTPKTDPSSGSGSSSSSSGSSGSSGGRSAGPIQPSALSPTSVASDTKLQVTMNSIPMNYANYNSSWYQDITGAYHLSIVSLNGEVTDAKNTFMCVANQAVNSFGQTISVLDYYYFDATGKMYTGWLRDANNVTYYFDKTAGANIGKLTRGWAEIDGSYYYFDGNGALLTNTTTPDGYVVGVDGKWIKV